MTLSMDTGSGTIRAKLSVRGDDLYETPQRNAVRVVHLGSRPQRRA
jgi:hypothetical protein